MASSNSPATTRVGDRDRGQAVHDAPVAQGADDVELVGPVHGVVDGRFRLHLGLGRREVGVDRGGPADVAGVEDPGGVQVLGVGRRTGGLVAVQRVADVRGQFGPQLRGALRPQRHRRRGVADGQRDEGLRAAHGDLGAEHPAPGLAQDVAALDPQGGDHGVELVDEELRGPELRGGVGQVGAATAPQLVVVHDGAAGLGGEGGEVGDVVVGHAGAAVQDDEREGTGPGVGGGGDLDPGPVAQDGQGAGLDGRGGRGGGRDGHGESMLTRKVSHKTIAGELIWVKREARTVA